MFSVTFNTRPVFETSTVYVHVMSMFVTEFSTHERSFFSVTARETTHYKTAETARHSRFIHTDIIQMMICKTASNGRLAVNDEYGRIRKGTGFSWREHQSRYPARPMSAIHLLMYRLYFSSRSLLLFMQLTVTNQRPEEREVKVEGAVVNDNNLLRGGSTEHFRLQVSRRCPLVKKKIL
jgi:hypothetical protein